MGLCTRAAAKPLPSHLELRRFKAFAFRLSEIIWTALDPTTFVLDHFLIDCLLVFISCQQQRILCCSGNITRRQEVEDEM